MNGYVHFVEHETDTFTIITFQWVQQASFNDLLTTVVVIKPMFQWRELHICMPNVDGLISLTRIVNSFQAQKIVIHMHMLNYLDEKAHPTPHPTSTPL